LNSETPQLKIVFVYLGSELPEYAVKNFIRTATLFPYEVLLFVEDSNYPKKILELPKNASINRLNRSSLKGRINLSHDTRFRDNFWSLTLERLASLHFIHDQFKKNTALLHIESDMLLLPTFPFDKVCGSKMRWFEHNQESDVGSIVFSPNATETAWLTAKIIEEAEADPFVTDMSALRRIRVKYGNRIETFPDIFNADEKAEKQDFFDGAVVGQWLFGVDTRNTYGFEVLKENGDFARSVYSEKLATLMRKVNLCVGDNGEVIGGTEKAKFSFHCFHIHSKKIDFFEISNTTTLSEYLKLDNRFTPQIKSWQMRVLWKLLRTNYQNNTLLSYLRHMGRYIKKKTDFETQSRMKAIMLFVLRRS
jgi:hypothetical protein